MISWFFWGIIYQVSWFGNANEANGWGSIYPYDADQSNFTVDSILNRVSNFFITTDKTVY